VIAFHEFRPRPVSNLLAVLTIARNLILDGSFAHFAT
jgi:hypothetical protein